MNDVLAVSRGETFGQHYAKLDGLTPGKWRTSETIAQRLSFQQLRHGVTNPVVRADIEQHEDIWVRQRRYRFALALEAFQSLRIVGQVLGQDLDGNVTAEPVVARPINLSHAARSKRSNDLVGAQTVTCGEGHRGLSV
jgi:hypothetical protein